MEMEQTAGSCPAPGQASVRTWLPYSTRGVARALSDSTSRFHGDGVRYKAKLIGVDPLPNPEGEKMCRDSMMKLKGLEIAARSQRKHKQRIWLKISSNGLKILDERSGAVLHDHEKSNISSLTKDESDPRALAYVYQHQDSWSLFYIKTANLADPVLVDIKEVCQSVNQETPQESEEAPAPTQPNPLLLLNDSAAPSPEEAALENVFSPRPDSSPRQSNPASSTNELMAVFSTPLEEALSPTHTPNPVQEQSSPQIYEPPKPMLSTAQILSMFPTQPLGGSPYPPPPYPPNVATWDQTGPLGNQWAGPAAGPWPSMPANAAAWAPPLGSPQQPGAMWGGNTPASPASVNGFTAPLNSVCASTGATEAVQSAPPSSNHDLLL